jgi:hypothetical protein
MYIHVCICHVQIDTGVPVYTINRGTSTSYPGTVAGYRSTVAVDHF